MHLPEPNVAVVRAGDEEVVVYEERPRDEVVSGPALRRGLVQLDVPEFLALKAARAQPDEVVVGLQPTPNIAVTITGA